MSTTDNRPPVTLSQLLHAEVVDPTGRRLGHIHGVRIVREGDAQEADQAPPYRVESLAVGRRGLLARLGLGEARAAVPVRRSQRIPWAAVIDLHPGRVVVRTTAAT